MEIKILTSKYFHPLFLYTKPRHLFQLNSKYRKISGGTRIYKISTSYRIILPSFGTRSLLFSISIDFFDIHPCVLSISRERFHQLQRTTNSPNGIEYFLNKKIHLLYNQNFMPNFSGLFDRIYRINLHLVFDRKQPLINGHSRWFLLEFVLFYRCYYYFQLSSDFEIAFSLRRLYIFKRLDKILLSTDRGR